MKITPEVYNAFHTPDDPGICCEDPSLTQEHFAESCDINKIMGDYTYTGIMPEKPGAIYGDFSNPLEYRDVLHKLQAVQENFLSMPPEVRARFGNDPAQFIDFCENPANLPELQRLGFTSEKYNQRTAQAASAASTQGASVASTQGASE
nr:MAG: internal scaffolding protein [Microvirus sp.]